MAIILELTGEQNKLPAVKLDDKIYFIQRDTYSKVHNEAEITERYTPSGEIDRQKNQTNKHRWNFTLFVPTSYALLDVTGAASADIGMLDDLHASAYKVAPSDLLEFWDITCYEDFTGSYTNLVYMSLEPEAPSGNDPSRWQVPVKLWGYDWP